MRVLEKDGLRFAIGLVWQRDSAESPVVIANIRKSSDFVLYAKTEVIKSNYCFVSTEEEGEVKDYISGELKLYSLAIFVIESLKTVLNNIIGDCFLCFKVDDKRYGVILIYKGSVFGHNGEICGTIDEVKEYIVKYTEEYGILVAHVLDDVEFLTDSDFGEINGLEIRTITAVSEEDNFANLSTSDYYLWNQDKRFKRCLSIAELKTLTLLQEKQQKLLIRVVIYVAIALLIFAAIKVLRNYYLPDQVPNTSKKPPKVLPVKSNGVEARVLFNKCFKPTIPLPVEWGMESLNCDLKQLTLKYGVYEGGRASIESLISSKNIPASTTHEITESGTFFVVTLVIPVDLSNTNSHLKKKDIEKQKMHLERYALAYDLFLVFGDGLPRVGTNITPAADKNKAGKANQFSTNKVTLISLYTPIYLEKKHVLDNINIYNVSMQLTQGRVPVWTIKGELSGD